VFLGLVCVAAASACTLEQRTDGPGSRQAAEAEASPRRQIVQPEGVARLPVFSSAVRSGDLLFLSGALGALQGTDTPTLVEGGIGPETRQTMENIRAVLEAAGLTMEDLVKCTVFLADIADYAAMNEVYVEYFPFDPPARSALATSGLALGARVEIECIAAYPEGT
jgi:2-iminobutanoate/2-iminopropanoate deaminase